MLHKLKTNIVKSLNEDKRTQLLSKSKNADKEKDGKNRYQKRVKSKVKANVSQLNKIDFNKLFKNNILTVNLEVQGETDNYLVTISFGSFLNKLQDELKNSNNTLNLRLIIRAVLNAFNNDDVYIKCSCPDFYYKHSFWASKNNIIAGDEKQNIPSNITNPNNTLGTGCKHIMLVLSNTSWCIKLASVIHNYINYMKSHYEKLYTDIIYPAIYDKPYEEPVQLDIDTLNVDDLYTDTSTIDKSNIEARDRGKFKIGNKIGNRFAPKNINYSIFDKEDNDSDKNNDS